MDMIRERPAMDLATHQMPVSVAAGGTISGDANPLVQDNPQVNTKGLETAPASSLQTAVGALRETIAAKALRGYDYMQIPSEDGFSTLKTLGDSVANYNQDELEFLADSRSTTELGMRQNQVMLTRDNQAAMAANPVTAVAASMLDVDAVIGLGVGKMAGVARSVRMAAGLAANSAVLGLASQGGTLTPLDVIGSSLGVALGAIPAVRKVATAAADAAEAAPVAERAAAKGPTETADTLATTDSTIRTPEPTAPPVEPVVAPEAPTKLTPDPDYVPPRPDLSTTRDHINVGVNKYGDMIQTSTQNWTRAVVNLSDDLPPGMKDLGKALSASLDSDTDIPLVYTMGGKTARSNFGVDKETLDWRVMLMSNDGKLAGTTMEDAIKAMPLQQRLTALHEAAHAKTAQNIIKWEKGLLPDGPVKSAINDIDSMRQAVDAATSGWEVRKGPRDNGLNYALTNNHEFISQMFNREDVRKAYQAVKVDGQGIWSRLVSRVVTAMTGKAPEADTAFTRTLAAFETLLEHPGDQKIKYSSADYVPHMQSELMRAPDVQGLARNFSRAVSPSFSLFDRVSSIGPKAKGLASQLIVDATGSSANSATHYARTAHLAANVAAAQVDASLSRALTSQGWNTLDRLRHPIQFRNAQKALSEAVYAKLAENHAAFKDGRAITAAADPQVEQIVQSFANSRWAEDQLERIKASGMLNSDKVEASPYYLPRQHSADKVNDFLRNNPDVDRKDVVGMYASQFSRMFADKGITDQSAKSLGAQMLRNMEQRADGVQGYRQHIAGMSDDDIEFAMRNAGIDDEQIQQFLGTANAAAQDNNTVKNLRRRAEFNMTEDYTTASGNIINPQMFVNKDVLGLMEGYSRNMSGRIGLARAGFPDIKSLAAAVDEAAGEAQDIRAARQTLDNTANQILGYPTGEDVPDILRSMTVASGAIQLANSGIFQLADSALIMKQFGVTKVFKALANTAFGRNAMDLAASPEYGSRLRDILEARNVLSGRYRTLVTHLDDNTDIGSMGIAHQMVQQMGQSTRFVNGMEYVRRGQSKLVAGLIGDTIDDAIRGNPDAVKAMARHGMTPELLEKARAATRTDPDLRTWPSSMRLDLETVGHNMADALVQENRLGEIPAWMQFSTLGKFVLPYMNFVAGAWNKILRRTAVQEGAAGLAMLAAYQVPLQVVSSLAAMTITAKDKKITPTSLTENVLSQLPMLSWLGMAISSATQGPTNSIAALGIAEKMFSATSGIVNGTADAETLIRATPFLSIIPGMRLLGSALGDDK